MPSKSIAYRLESARLALHNALREGELQAALAPFGYDEGRLQQGKSYYETALAVWQADQQSRNRRRAAVAAYAGAEQAADRAYMRAVKLARVLFRDNEVAYRSLGLVGKRKRSFPLWVDQMRLFYTTALNSPDILAALSAHGLGQSQLHEGLALVAAVENVRAQRGVERGEAQGAAGSRRQALDTLDRWMGDFAAIARLALADRPQGLEMLGLAGD